METWFTSDLHLGHAKIIELCNRPFADVDQMNKEIIQRWNNVVSDDDAVYVLGDVALGTIAETLPLIEKLKGHKHLVPGNHDRCWSGNKKIRPIDIQRYKDVGFNILPEQLEYRGWLLCHFPATGDSRETDRYLEHRPIPKYNQWLIHGHVHEKWRIRIKDRQINVGVDVWNFEPVNRRVLDFLVSSFSD